MMKFDTGINGAHWSDALVEMDVCESINLADLKVVEFEKIDKPTCVKCGRTVEPWAFYYVTATCSTCIEMAKQ